MCQEPTEEGEPAPRRGRRGSLELKGAEVSPPAFGETGGGWPGSGAGSEAVPETRLHPKSDEEVTEGFQVGRGEGDG